MFQSLFYWTAESNPPMRLFSISIILLFQSLFYWTAESNKTGENKNENVWNVSILVLLDSRIKQTKKFWNASKIGVSILVLLDSRIKRDYTADFQFRIRLFQSLFYWTAESNAHSQLAITFRSKFQSLFYWTAESNSKFNDIYSNDCRCFNPCFIGQQNQTYYFSSLLAYCF